MRFLAISMVGFLMLLPFVANAEDIEVMVTREAADVYRVVGDDLFIFTEYCFEMSDSEKAILRFEEADKIIFSTNNDTCGIKISMGGKRV